MTSPHPTNSLFDLIKAAKKEDEKPVPSYEPGTLRPQDRTKEERRNTLKQQYWGGGGSDGVLAHTPKKHRKAVRNALEAKVKPTKSDRVWGGLASAVDGATAGMVLGGAAGLESAERGASRRAQNLRGVKGALLGGGAGALLGGAVGAVRGKKATTRYNNVLAAQGLADLKEGKKNKQQTKTAIFDAFLAKVATKLDPVGQEDADIDNDGKPNDKNDQYLRNRRKVVSKAIKSKRAGK